PASGGRRSQSRASGLSATTPRTGRTRPMNDAHSNVAVGEGCSFIPDLDEFWAADTWQLANGESLPGLAVVREGGALHWQGLTPSLTAELKWAAAHKFISHEWTLAAGEPSSHCSDPSSPGWPTTHLIRR